MQLLTWKNNQDMISKLKARLESWSQYSYFKSLTSVTKPISLIGISPQVRCLTSSARSCEGQVMYLGDDKNCKAFFASANYPYSEDLLTTVSRLSLWYRGATMSISALFENCKECEKAQDIRTEFKSIDN